VYVYICVRVYACMCVCVCVCVSMCMLTILEEKENFAVSKGFKPNTDPDKQGTY